jgi:hypothetical protein
MDKKTTKDLLAIVVADLLEERKGFSYLPWAAAWTLVLGIDENATYEVERNLIDGLQCFGNPDIGYTVYTSLTFQGFTRKESLPVFNGTKSIKKPDTYQINTAVKRCLVKNIALFGLGLSVYVGEDIPKNLELDGYELDDNGKIIIPEDKTDKNAKPKDKIDITKDPFEKPGVKVPDDSKKNDKAGKDKSKNINQKPATPKYEKDFIIAVNARKDFTKGKKERLLNDDSITKIIKQNFIKTGKGL